VQECGEDNSVEVLSREKGEKGFRWKLQVKNRSEKLEGGRTRFSIFAHGGGLYTNIDDNDVFETSAKSMFSGATSMYFRLQGT